jgi:hypothetical protein
MKVVLRACFRALVASLAYLGLVKVAGTAVATSAVMLGATVTAVIAFRGRRKQLAGYEQAASLSEFQTTNDPRSSNPRSAALSPAPDSLALDGADVAAVAAVYRREMQSPRQWALVGGGIGGLALGAALMEIGDRFGWPAGLAPVFFVGGWGVFLWCEVVVWRRAKRLRATHQLYCPDCQAPFLDEAVSQGAQGAVDRVVATGHCPRCGSRVLPA